MSQDIEALLKVSDVAERTQLSVGAVYKAIKEGRLKAARLGSKQSLRIDPEELKRWIRENTQNPQDQNPNLIIL